MKKIYLDMNIFAEYIDKNRDFYYCVNKLITNLKNKEHLCLYSPAHIEEIALILSSEKDISVAKTYINEMLDTISLVTNNNECLPTENEIIIKNEHPKICYERVKDEYSYTFLAEISAQTKHFFIQKNIDGVLYELDINRSYIGNIEPKNLFNDIKIKQIFTSFMGDTDVAIEKWEKIKNYHKKIETTISILFAFIDFIRYKADGIKKYRSIMHDVTHSIYGTKSDVFITNDKKFRLRLEAIYNYIEVPTKILFLKDLKDKEECDIQIF